MLGAIIGDIVGSKYEFNNIKTKDFPLFSNGCKFTDDTIMTVAIAKAILECNGNYSNLSELTTKYMVEIGRKYPYSGYGFNFERWVFSEEHEPYESYGNGSAMRVSPCGIIANSLEEAKELARKVTIVSHNHVEGIKGAVAVASAIYLAKEKKTKEEIKEYITKNYYNIDFTLDEIRDTYEFNETCQKSVPQALEAFFESTSFEDTIRNAISIGGDSDTIAAIAGSIAEMYYGIPQNIKDKALTYLDEELKDIVIEFENRVEKEK